ncbi:hypothetical protein F183_A18450 [Bryobacterales bacterium F-183]|nr:hypothetical protein F183_A18450 [Bryobacterales bacterium F-183]
MPPNSSTSTSKWILATAGLTLTAVGAFNFWVDPFQQYRASAKPRFWHTLQRQITPGLAKRGGYDVVLLGSSMFECFRNSEASQHLGGKAANLSLSSSSAYELGMMLNVALSHTPGVRRVVLDLNVNTYAGPTNKLWVQGPLPLHMWDRNPFNDVRYLLAADTFQRSLDIVRGKEDKTYRTDPDLPWGWALDVRFSREEATKGLLPGDFNQRYKQPPRTTEEMVRNFETNPLPIIRSHPQIQFDLVHPPYSILAWIDFEQRKQVELTLDWKRRLFQLTQALPNVAIYDFQGDRRIEDLDHYTDIYHFDLPTASWMLKEIGRGAGSEFRVTASNLEPMLKIQQERAKSAKAEDWLKKP